MKAYLMITSVLLVLFGVTACAETGTPGTSAATAARADLKDAAERWSTMTVDEQKGVCLILTGALPGEVRTSGTSTYSPDYRAVLKAVEDAGYSESQSTAMIPYVMNECR